MKNSVHGFNAMVNRPGRVLEREARGRHCCQYKEARMSKLVKYFGVSFKKGDYIFREGDLADVMYMIHKGKVQISKGTGTFNEKIRILGEGEFIGEMAVINSKPRSASAVAVENCVLI